MNDEDMLFEDMVSRMESRGDEKVRENNGQYTVEDSKKGSSSMAKNIHDYGKKCHICDKETHLALDCFYKPKSNKY